MNLAKPIYIIENHSVQIKCRKLTDSGKNTGEFHYRTLSPVADISEEPEAVRAIVNAARIGYVKPEQSKPE